MFSLYLTRPGIPEAKSLISLSPDSGTKASARSPLPHILRAVLTVIPALQHPNAG